MGMPHFHEPREDMTRENVVNQIIASIAMEELSLSHILNAEGEKLQYILGTLSGSSGVNPTFQQVMEANQSVKEMVSAATQNQLFLQSKMETALNSAVMQGPPGPTGPAGAVGDGPLWYAEAGTTGFGVEYQDTVTFTSTSLVVDSTPANSSVSINLPVDLGVVREFNDADVGGYVVGEIIVNDAGDFFMVQSNDPIGDLNAVPPVTTGFLPLTKEPATPPPDPAAFTTPITEATLTGENNNIIPSRVPVVFNNLTIDQNPNVTYVGPDAANTTDKTTGNPPGTFTLKKGSYQVFYSANGIGAENFDYAMEMGLAVDDTMITETTGGMQYPGLLFGYAIVNVTNESAKVTVIFPYTGLICNMVGKIQVMVSISQLK